MRLEDFPAFRHVGNAAADDVLRIAPVDALPLEEDGTLVGLVFDEAQQRFEDGGLAGPVVAQDGGDAARIHGERGPPDGVDQVVIGFDIPDFKQRIHGAPLLPGKP